MKRKPLTPQQAKAYALIVAGLQVGQCPTMAELGRAMGRSRVTVHQQVDALARKGYLAKVFNEPRGLSIVEPLDPRYADSEARRLHANAHELLSYVQDKAVTGCIEAQSLVETITGKAVAS